MRIRTPFLLMFSIFVSIAHGETITKPELLVVRGEGEWPPYEMTIKGELQGFHIELIKLVASQANMNVRFETHPFKRALKLVEHGRADAITYVSKTPDREYFLFYFESNILSGAEHYFIKHRTRGDIHYAGDLRALKNKSIAYIEGFYLGEEFGQANYLDKFSVRNAEVAASLVAKKRCDLAVITSEDLKRTWFLDIQNDLSVITPPLHSTIVYMGLSKHSLDQHTINNFTSAMTSFKQTQKFSNLLKKYNITY